MLEDLPEINNIFSKNDETNEEIIEFDDESLINKDIYIYISKEPNKWISVSFIDIAPSGIGIHVLLPIIIEFSPEELNNIKIKFEKKVRNSTVILKQTTVLVRWQERDSVSGNLKLGLHFPGETKSDPIIIDILKKLQEFNIKKK
ncbi:MAG: hypothetical protein JXB50_00750 [Spirochaetes bacterium]|nr:hypothetical protein [Spirochaetota bacterium]